MCIPEATHYATGLALLMLMLSARLASAQTALLPMGRPSDSLLARPALQQLVEWQSARRAAPLIGALQSADVAVRARAAFALASVQDSAAVPALIRRLGDPAPTVRADATFALGQSEGRVPPRTLLRALRAETDATVQARLLEALGKKGDRASLAALVETDVPAALVPDKALTVGRYALRDVHAPSATAYLLNRIGSKRAEVRQSTAYTFGRSRETAPWADDAGRVRAALDGLAPADPAALHLLRALSRLQDEKDTERFARWLREGADWRIRTEAARALAAGADSSRMTAPAFAALAEALGDSLAHVGITAAEALASHAPWTPERTAALRAWLEAHPDRWRVAAPLLMGFARQGETDAVLRRLDRWRQEENTWAYAAGLHALEPTAESAEARQRLFQAAQEDDPRVAAAALDALAGQWQALRTADAAQDSTLRRAYFDVFAEALRRDDLATRYHAAPLLADSLFQPYGAVEVLRTVYARLQTPDDAEPMTAILTALGQAGDPSSEPLLREALGHPHPVIRQAAAGALRTLTGEAPPLPPAAEDPSVRDSIDWGYLAARGPQPRLVLETEKGEVVLRLDAEEAPLTTQTILRLAESGAYDGVPFHRVVPNFVVQGGDVERGDGFGGPGFAIRSEFTRIPYGRYAVGMASAGKDTEGSQLFVTHSAQPHLDGGYTAFGVVEKGRGVIDRLYEGDRIVKAAVRADQ